MYYNSKGQGRFYTSKHARYSTKTKWARILTKLKKIPLADEISSPLWLDENQRAQVTVQKWTNQKVCPSHDVALPFKYLLQWVLSGIPSHRSHDCTAHDGYKYLVVIKQSSKWKSLIPNNRFRGGLNFCSKLKPNLQDLFKALKRAFENSMTVSKGRNYILMLECYWITAELESNCSSHFQI